MRCRDRWVRVRVAECLGRLGFPVPAELLRRFLGDRDAEVRRMLVWSAERLAQAGLLGDAQRLHPSIARLARGAADPLLRARALFALSAMDPVRAERAVREALVHRKAAVRCAATALILPVLGPEEGEALLLERASDRALCVRIQAVESFVEIGTRKAARELVRRLEAEPEERLSWTIVERLRELSGRKHRRDPRPWLDWVEELSEGWRAEPRARQPAELAPGRTLAFAGLPILSQRVVFLIDLSGSIWKVRADGRTRKQVIDSRLGEVLEELPETTAFNLIPYAGEPLPWRDELARATPRNVRAATRFFEECETSGSGNFWDAAMLAMQDPEVDTLVVLTDGAPTGGRHNRLELLVPLFLELDATRKVAVDSILVDAPVRLREHWARLARETGGRSVAVHLE
jgi:hypothetical protein